MGVLVLYFSKKHLSFLHHVWKPLGDFKQRNDVMIILRSVRRDCLSPALLPAVSRQTLLPQPWTAGLGSWGPLCHPASSSSRTGREARERGRGSSVGSPRRVLLCCGGHVPAAPPQLLPPGHPSPSRPCRQDTSEWAAAQLPSVAWIFP